MLTYATRRCLLRSVQLSDAPVILRNFSDPRVMAHYDAKRVCTRAAAEKTLSVWKDEIASGRRQRWTIILRDADFAIGTCGLHGIDRERGCAEIGYEIGQAYWGRGILSEVLPAVLEHAFSELELDRLTARVSPQNRASIALLRKFGFRNRVAPQIAGWLRGASFNRRIFRLKRREYLQQTRLAGSVGTCGAKAAALRGLQDPAT